MSDRPNVLLITADQHRADAVGSRSRPAPDGSRPLRTPYFDALAASGISWANAFSAMPVCVPARATIMTGCLPAVRGELGNNATIPAGTPTLPAILGAGGYRTQAIGKMHFEPDYRALNGFDHAIISEEGRQWRRGGDDYQDYLRSVGWEGLERGHGIGNNDVRSGTSPLPLEHYHTTWCTNESIRWLRDHQRTESGRPFFLWTSYTKPHSPYDPPEPYDRLYSPFAVPPPIGGPGDLDDRSPWYRSHRRRFGWDFLPDLAIRRSIAFYLGNVTLIDHSVGRLLETLRELGLEDDTIVIYTADHGDLLGDHGFFFKGLFWDASWHIPLVIRAPGRLPSGKAAPGYAGLQDLLPTVLDLCGFPVPADLHGRSLVSSEPLAEAAFGTFSRSSLLESQHALRTDDWVYIVHRNGGFEELYDERSDPEERINLGCSPDHADVREEFRRRIEAWLSDTGIHHALGEDGHVLTEPFRDLLEGKEPLADTPLGFRPH